MISPSKFIEGSVDAFFPTFSSLILFLNSPSLSCVCQRSRMEYEALGLLWFKISRHGRSCWIFPCEWDWNIKLYKQVLGPEEQ